MIEGIGHAIVFRCPYGEDHYRARHPIFMGQVVIPADFERLMDDIPDPYEGQVMVCDHHGERLLAWCLDHHQKHTLGSMN